MRIWKRVYAADETGQTLPEMVFQNNPQDQDLAWTSNIGLWDGDIK